MNKHLIYVVIPAFNESKVIKGVLKNIKKEGYTNIILVDDGSADDTNVQAKKIKGVTVLRHGLNRGKGAAAKTGIEAAKLLGADIIVVMDGDGQHDPLDIEPLVSPIKKEGVDVALGTRLKNRKEMPFVRKMYNLVGNFISWYLTGLWVTDSQSGFRAYSKLAANIINTKADRYEYESEIIREIYKNNLSYKEVPIKVKYTDYSKGKIHQQGLMNGFKTVYKLIWNLIS